MNGQTADWAKKVPGESCRLGLFTEIGSLFFEKMYCILLCDLI